MSLGSIVVRLSMQTADFETDAGRASKVAQRRAREIDSAFRSAGVAIGVALGAAAVGMRKYIQNTVEAEKVQAQLAARIKDTAGAAGRSIAQLGDQAERLQGLTIFDDETIGNAQAMLLTFTNIRGIEFDRTIESALDLATVMGTDATDAAKLLGRALSDPEKGMSALARAGIVFTDAEREVIKAMAEAGNMADAQDAILDKLQGTMGSAAEAARNTLGGALQGLQNSFDNLLEGDTSQGGLKGTVDAINRLNTSLNDPSIKQGIDTIASGFLGMAGAAATAAAKLGELIGSYEGWLAKQGFVPDGSDGALGARKGKLEARIAQLQKPSMFGNAPDPIAKAFGFDQLKLLRQELAKVNAELVGNGVNRAFTGLPALAPPALPPLGRDPAMPSPSPRGRGGATPRAAALPNFLAEDQEALRRMVEQTAQADAAFAGLAATLSGPLAEAEYAYTQALQRIAEMGMEAGRSTSEVNAVKVLETERYEEQRKAIEASLNPMQQLLDSYQAEIDMIGLSNAEKSMMNALREKGIDLAGSEAQAYMKAARSADSERQALEDSMGDQIQFMDAFREGATDALVDFATGAKSAEDALKDFGHSMAALVTRMIAENWIRQLFGPQGSPGGGSAGGWLASFAGMLFGAGSGKASGGYTGAGGVHEPAGIVHRGEVVWSQGDIARSGGVSAVEHLRRGGASSGSGRRQRIILVENQRDAEAMLRSSRGEDAMLLHIENNASRIREIIAG